MPSLLDIRRRIRAVRSTQQITKAMKMVAASRLRRAQDRVVRARPFAVEMRRVITSLVPRVEATRHPLLDARVAPRAGGKALLFVVTGDRGLCGSFNSNVIRAAGAFILERGSVPVALALLGKKGRDFFVRRGFEVVYEHAPLFATLRYEDAQAAAAFAIAEFTGGRADGVWIVYNEFRSVLQQRVVLERLLPLVDPWAADGEGGATGGVVDYLYEPSPQAIFDALLPRVVEVRIYRALLESAAAEHAARMTAMDAATKNAGDMIDHLTLHLNKVRQAAITREIIEVVSGAEAL
jgi:F-type H+-transporting ATPase subunit gamma